MRGVFDLDRISEDTCLYLLSLKGNVENEGIFLK